MKFLLSIGLFFCLLSNSYAQETIYETLAPSFIKTVEFTGSNQKFGGTPIVPLGSSLFLSFDDLNGNESDYYYQIEHLDFDWTPSSLSKNEVMIGFDNVRIRHYKNSFGTLQNYTHYTLKIPNETTQGLRVSGNYLLKILDEEGALLFSRKFIVYESKVSVKVAIKRSRDLKYIDQKQVVNFTVGSNFSSGKGSFIFRNPKKNVHTLLIQNNDLHAAISNLSPQYTVGNQLVYKYDQAASFYGGNEYLAFESKDLRTASLHTKHVSFDQVYQHYLFTDGVRADRPYTYNPDINGFFKVNATEGKNDAIEADYVRIHFSLACPKPLQGGQLYLYGNFNNYALTKDTRLIYNKQKEVYETSLLLKQGYYDYRYILLSSNGEVDAGFIGGNFDETENQYTVLVYYRAPGARYDRVIGAGSANSRNITN